ncbi:hypothetical protein BC829DRAFT_485856 [Chytridium lagenaria]|nr:hypothetical protein BC829DRAFT_485856 [Chytridium lagenaria]
MVAHHHHRPALQKSHTTLTNTTLQHVTSIPFIMPNARGRIVGIVLALLLVAVVVGVAGVIPFTGRLWAARTWSKVNAGEKRVQGRERVKEDEDEDDGEVPEKEIGTSVYEDLELDTDLPLPTPTTQQHPPLLVHLHRLSLLSLHPHIPSPLHPYVPPTLTSLLSLLLLQLVLLLFTLGIPLDVDTHYKRIGFLGLACMAVSVGLGIRNSVLRVGFGVGYEKGLVWHRWIGVSGVGFVAMHGGLFWLKWLNKGSLYKHVTRAHVFPGFLSTLLVILIFTLSLPTLRRRLYSLFYISHILLVPISLFLLVLHTKHTIEFTIIPLLLYAVDRIIRYHNARQPAQIRRAVPMVGGVKVWLDTAKKFTTGQYVFLNVPSLGTLWHPFSVANAPEMPEKSVAAFHAAIRDSSLFSTHPDYNGETFVDAKLNELSLGNSGILLIVKSCGPFTQRFHQVLGGRDDEVAIATKYSDVGGEDTTTVYSDVTLDGLVSDITFTAMPRIRLEGAYGRSSVSPKEFAGMVCVAGGVGLTGVLGYVGDAVSLQFLSSTKIDVGLVWVVKSTDVVFCMEDLVVFARVAGVEVLVCVTGGSEAFQAKFGGGVGKEVEEEGMMEDEEKAGRVLEWGLREGAGRLRVMRGRVSEEEMEGMLRRRRDAARRSGWGGDVGVVACGPDSLVAATRDVAMRMSSQEGLFHFHAESFKF